MCGCPSGYILLLNKEDFSKLSQSDAGSDSEVTMR